jgi:glycosyltransferase involved in cell wall biosynthesis
METGAFVSPTVPRAETRKRLGLEDHHVAVGTIALLFHLKGHDDLMEAAPSLCARHPRLKFLWVGDGLLRAQFEQRITQLNLRDRFILTGLVPPARIPELAHAMDVLVHPSRREGLARALPQASLAQKPVVTYDVDGNREGVLDGETGFVIPAFDQRKLVQSVDLLLADESLRRSMGEAGRRFAVARFDANVMVDALELLYSQLLHPVGV